jgi:hypothetical protein
MGAVVGDLAVRVGSDITDLQQGMSKASKSIGGFAKTSTKQLRAVTGNIVKMAAAAGLAAAGGLLAMAKSAASSAQEIKNLSTVANATATEFQKWTFASRNLGVENDKLSDILKDVNDKVGDFLTTGGGPLVDFFEQIAPKVGVTAEQFRNLSGPKALQLFHSSLEKANLSQAEMTFHLEAIASDLTLLQPLLADGGKLLAQQSKIAENLGLILSDVDIAQLDTLQESFTIIGALAESASDIIGAKLAPYVTVLTEKFIESGGAGTDFGEQVDAAMVKAAQAVGFVADAVHGLNVVFDGLKLIGFSAIGGISHLLQGAAEIFVLFGDAAIETVNAVINAFNSIPGLDDIPNLTLMTDSDFMKSIRESNEEIRMTIGEMAANFAELTMQEMPSDNVVRYLDDVKTKSIEAAQAVSSVRDEFSLIASDPFMGDDPSMEFEDFFAINAKDWGIAVMGAGRAMQNIVQTMSTGSKQAFKISKAWALADAIISTAQAIAAANRLGYPMAIPAIAWAAATGFAQITAIKNQSFGGGGGAAASGGGTPGVAPNPVGVGGGGGAQQSQTLSVAPIDPGAIFSGAQMQSFGESIHDFSKDGGKVVFEA